MPYIQRLLQKEMDVCNRVQEGTLGSVTSHLMEENAPVFKKSSLRHCKAQVLGMCHNKEKGEPGKTQGARDAGLGHRGPGSANLVERDLDLLRECPEAFQVEATLLRELVCRMYVSKQALNTYLSTYYEIVVF